MSWKVFSELRRDVIDDEGNLIATAYAIGDFDDASEAAAEQRAALISAAPELLEALRIMATTVALLAEGASVDPAKIDEAFSKTNAALAKAAGRK